jgi:hypothetical protein
MLQQGGKLLKGLLIRGVGISLITVSLCGQALAWHQGQGRTSLLSIPGAVFSSQIHSQQEKFKRANTFSMFKPDVSEDIIFTDRFKNPVSEQKFVREIQVHHQNIYEKPLQGENTVPLIEPPPPEEAYFQ